MDYLFHIIFIIAIYATLGVALDLLVGQAGLLALSQSAFFGIGAYSSAILSLRYSSLSPLWGFAIGIILAAMASLVISLPSLRVRDDFFTLVSFGFQVIVFSALNNWLELTRGPVGIPGIPRLRPLGDSDLAWVVAGLVLVSSTCALVRVIANSPFGRVLRAIREDEVFASSMGKDARYFKAVAFSVCACIAAFSGSFYAHYSSYVDPTSFTVNESIFVLSIVIIGGAGSVWGSILGAAVLVGLPEILRLVGLPTSLAANIRQIMYGSLLVVMMTVRPRGFVGKFGFGDSAR